MKMKSFMTTLLLIMLTAFAVTIWIIFFTSEHSGEVFFNIGLAVASVVLVLTTNSAGDWIYKDFRSSNKTFEFMGYLKLSLYVITAQSILSIFWDDPKWWILSVALGLIVFIIELFGFSFMEGNN